MCGIWFLSFFFPHRVPVETAICLLHLLFQGVKGMASGAFQKLRSKGHLFNPGHRKAQSCGELSLKIGGLSPVFVAYTKWTAGYCRWQSWSEIKRFFVQQNQPPLVSLWCHNVDIYCPSTSMTSSLALASALASPGGGAPAPPASPGGGVDPVLA